jgi:hypothetical protein
LSVTGSDAGETIEIRKQGFLTWVYDNGTPAAAFDSLGVNSVNVDARGGNDTVRVTRYPVYTGNVILDGLYNRSLRATINGGSGTDRLYGEAAPDAISGGSGTDYI